MARGRDYAGAHRHNQEAGKAKGRKPAGKGKGRASAADADAAALPVWAWMAMGISLILLATVIYTISRPAGPLHLSPTSESLQAAGKKGQSKKIVIPPREKPAYDFYTMLPNEQVANVRPHEAALGEARPPPASLPPQTSVTTAIDLVAEQTLAEAAQASQAALPVVRREPAPAPARELAVVRPPPPTTKPAPAPAPPKPKAEPPRPPVVLAIASTLGGKPTSSASAASPAGSGRYAVQTAAYRKRDDAENQRAALALNGLNARVEAGEVKGRTWFRVRLGPYASRDAALGANARLAASGFNGVLVPLGR